MNQRIKDLWAKALRSGTYEQTPGSLHTIDGFCCLGVRCDLSRKEGNGEWDTYDGEAFVFVEGSKREWDLLPPSVQQWANLASACPIVNLEEGIKALSELNDAGATFEQIATLIEEQL